MGQLYNPYPKLPKNIRQIGERDQIVKLYMEDYVNTYLQRLYPAGGQDLRAGLLLGSSEQHEGTPYIFIDGAMEMEGITRNGQKIEFSESAWKEAYEEMERLFPKRMVLGWFLCAPQGGQLSPLNYWKEHVKYFPGKNQLMYLNAGLEGEEAVYITSEDGFYKLRGHCIYYERNQMMQDYMILRKDVKRAETGTADDVVKDFRQRIETRKTAAKSRQNTIGVLGGLCSVLTVAVLAGGITMFNNYEKMRRMESVMASVLPDNVKSWQDYELGQMKLTVEEIPGEVYPTEEEGEHFTLAQETDNQLQSGEEPDAEAENAGDETPSGESQAARTDGGSSLAAAVSVPDSYIVGTGETLRGICLKFYHDLSKMEEICRVNGLEDPDKIISGQKLILP